MFRVNKNKVQETIALGYVIHNAETGEVLASGLTSKGKEYMDRTKDERILELENALYEVMKVSDLAYAKEIAAEALEEDLDEFLEEEGIPQELDFSDDDRFIVDDEFEDK